MSSQDIKRLETSNLCILSSHLKKIPENSFQLLNCKFGIIMQVDCKRCRGELRESCSSDTIEKNKNATMLEYHPSISMYFGENSVEGIKKEETDVLGLSAVSHFKIFLFFVFSCCHNKLPQTQWVKGSSRGTSTLSRGDTSPLWVASNR